MIRSALASERVRQPFAGFRRTTGFLFAAATLVTAIPARADCLDDAAAFHHVNASLLRAIAIQESSMRADAISRNTNGTFDIGLMQINSTWLPTLRKWGIDRSQLLDACISAYIGAWILEQNIKQYGLTWNAVGAYNAASPEKRLAYANRIYKRLMQYDGHEPTVGAPLSVSPQLAHGPRKSQVGFRQASSKGEPASFSSRRAIETANSLAAYEASHE